MYTRQETSRQKQAFWTTFGQYMRPVLSAEGIETNWINYKTRVKGINFRMDADEQQASIGIVLSHSDVNVQQEHYDQLLKLKQILQDTLGEVWQWQALLVNNEGKTISQVTTSISSVNINCNEDWPALISFFKPRIIALDAFWSQVKYGFEGLSW